MKANATMKNRKAVETDRNRASRGTTQPAYDQRHLTVQFANIKNGLVREFGTALGGHGQLLASALNEAEALAWQTGYPHLLFPVLAEEKASGINLWAARQRRVRQASREIALAV
jgi:hypothetical protein